MNNLLQRVKEKGIELTISDDVVNLLVDKGYNPAFGARPLKRILQKEVTDRIANLLLKGDANEGDKLEVRLNGTGVEVVKV